MFSCLSHSIVLALCLPAALAQTTNWDLKSFSAANTITRDVAVIGGGSAGTFAAIQIKNKGKSVVVVETKPRLGGHTETYTDPKTGRGIDMGVIVWHNISIVTDYFKRFDVPLTIVGSDLSGGPQATEGVYDLKTGKAFPDPRPNQTAVGAAFQLYTQQLLKYPKLDEGMFLPDPVPEDLIMPFGKFAKKYKIEAALPTMFQYNAGVGDLLTVPTVENMRTWGLSLVSALQGGFLTTARHNNSELYGKAQNELNTAKSVLLNSQVVYAERNTTGVQLVVTTPTGTKLIKAKRLLITIPPKLEYLKPFSLSTQESQVFGKLLNTGYYTSILQNTGLPDNLGITNLSPFTPSNLPTLPAVYSIGSSIYTPGLKLAFLGAPLSNVTRGIPDKTVLDTIIASVKRLQTANPTKFNKTSPSFVQYSSHSPFYLQAKGADIKAGFYKKMYALQGARSTYWTGAAWRAHDSSDIWRYTAQHVLPGLLKGL